jgi:hypothetical protein
MKKRLMHAQIAFALRQATSGLLVRFPPFQSIRFCVLSLVDCAETMYRSFPRRTLSLDPLQQ